MLFDRQKLLLALLDTLGGEVGNLDFQKLLFLYCTDIEEAPTYEFVPYKFGGFSFTSYADKRRLIEQELLMDEERAWHLTTEGKTAAVISVLDRSIMERFARRYVDLRGDALVAEAYRRHPYHAVRSEIAHRVLADDLDTLQAIDKARPRPIGPGICTIGYEGWTVEGYMNRLILAGVSLLCDVRRNPLSRKYGFSKGTLSKVCEGLGITYVHLPELGIASEDRQALVTQADYDALFAEYRVKTLPQQTPALCEIQRWVIAGRRVALTCYENDPRRCHRQCVAEELAKLFGSAFIPQQL
ncbi:MAG TPA: DUF488 domain-containing protein [Armatimonadota bacterium]|jgi:hypothetical protein